MRFKVAKRVDCVVWGSGVEVARACWAGPVKQPET